MIELRHAVPPPTRGQAGFTLLELMLAMGILTFGITAVLGVLSVGVDSRRTAEMRGRAVVLAERIVQEVERATLAEHPLPDEFVDEDLAIPTLVVEEVDGFPGMRYSVEFVTDPTRPDLVLLKIRVAWLEQGADQGVELRRIVPRQVPFSLRVAARRNEER
ncbi:MAG: prepilin-type N-terminal cleavage/methylation domain-containing protein [Planctomycetes bacterium]|nr:prepilin-type N-terminal cleavage/methylation domain-containing protein [Planctomycetota bacterium]